MDKIKYYTDEHISKAIIKGLRRRDVTILTVVEAEMMGASDKEHLEKAFQEGYAIFTQDNDFLRLHSEGLEHKGIVYAPQGTSISKIISGLMLIHQVLKPVDMYNHIEFL